MVTVGRTGVLVVADGSRFRPTLRRVLQQNQGETLQVPVTPDPSTLRRTRVDIERAFANVRRIRVELDQAALRRARDEATAALADLPDVTVGISGDFSRAMANARAAAVDVRREFTNAARVLSTPLRNLASGISARIEIDTAFLRRQITDATSSVRARIQVDSARIRTAVSDAIGGTRQRINVNTAYLRGQMSNVFEGVRHRINLDTAFLRSQISNVTQRINVQLDRSGLRAAASAVGRFFSTIPQLATQAASSAGSAISSGFQSAFQGLTAAGGAVQNALSGVGRAISGAFEQGQASIQGLTDSLKGATGPLGAVFDAITAGVKIMAAQIAIIVQFAVVVGGLWAVAGLVVQAFEVMGGAALIFGSILQSVATGAVLALPAVLGGLAVAGLAVVSAFEGFADALEEGPGSEAMEALPDNAQEAATALFGLKEALDEIKASAADTFWEGLSDNIEDLADSALPALDAATQDAASGLNDLVESLLNALDSTEVTQGLTDIGESLGDAFSGLAEPVEEFVEALGILASAGAPILEEIGEAAGGLLEDFAGWVREAEESGRLQEIFENLSSTLGTIWEIVGNLLGGFGNLFGFAEGASGTFLENMEAATAAFEEWAGSAEAREFVEFLTSSAMDFFTGIYNAITAFKDWASSEDGKATLDSMVAAAELFAQFIGDAIGQFIAWAGTTDGQDTMMEIVRAAIGFLTVLVSIGSIIFQILSWMLEVWNTLTDWINTIYDIGAGLAGLLNPLGAVKFAVDAINNGLLEALGNLFNLQSETNEFEGAQGGRPGGGRSGNAIPRRARGGMISSPEVALIGEAGRELILPMTNKKRTQQLLQSSGVLGMLSNSQRASVGGSPHVTININGALQPRAIGIQVERAIARALGG